MSQELLDLLLKAVEIVKSNLPTINEEIRTTEVEENKTTLNSPMLDLLKSDEWIEAIPNVFICDENSEADKMDRAEGIIEYIHISLQNLKFLDFGCGEGHTVKKASDLAKISIGYDIKESGSLIWEESQNYLLTTNMDKIIENGPYDIILLYDVLDHSSNPVEILNKIKKICNSNTKIFVRCHSWMSRHGAHTYNKINKAWAHLFLSPEELDHLGIKIDNNQVYFKPIGQQNKWFNESGFKILSSDMVRSEVPSFFNKKIFNDKFGSEFNGSFPEFQMSQDFNDYILAIK